MNALFNNSEPLSVMNPWHAYGQGDIPMGYKPAIVVVDVQNAFTDPSFSAGGGSPLIERAVSNLVRLLDVAREYKVPIFYVRVAYDSPSAAGLWNYKAPHNRLVLTDTRWSKIDDRIAPKGEPVITKRWPSCFFETLLLELLHAQHIDCLLMTGCNTSGCVRASVTDAFSYQFPTMVIEDCVGDLTQGAHDANLIDIGRRYANVVSIEEAIQFLTDTQTQGNSSHA